MSKEINNDHQIHHHQHHHNIHQHIQQNNQDLLMPSSSSCSNSSSGYSNSLNNNQQQSQRQQCMMPPPNSMHSKSPTQSSRISRHNVSLSASSQSSYNSNISLKLSNLSSNDPMIVGGSLFKEELIISGNSPSNVQYTDSNSNCSIIMNNDPSI